MSPGELKAVSLRLKAMPSETSESAPPTPRMSGDGNSRPSSRRNSTDSDGIMDRLATFRRISGSERQPSPGPLRRTYGQPKESPFATARANLGMPPQPPLPSAERVLMALPTFVREAAMRRVSEEDVSQMLALKSVSDKNLSPGVTLDPPNHRRSFEREMVHQQRVSQLPENAQEQVSLHEPMVRHPSDAQTVIPTVDPYTRDEGVRSSSVTNVFITNQASAPANLDAVLRGAMSAPTQQTMSETSGFGTPQQQVAPDAATMQGMTDEERAEALAQRRQDRRCSAWQQSAQAIGTLAAGAIGSVGVTLSACNCCTKANTAAAGAAGLTDGSDQAHLMAGFGMGWMG